MEAAARPPVTHAEPQAATWEVFSPRWQYRRFGVWDGLTVASGAAVALTSTLLGPPAEARWQGGVLFDDGVRSALRADSRAGRDRARAVGDTTYITGALLPTLLDGLIVTLGAHGASDVAGQMLLINVEAYAVAAALLVGSENLFARARPSMKPCAEDDNYEAYCNNPDEKSSFISGHTGVVATSAGLLCAHHQYLDLYGNQVADAAACGLGIGLALTTGVARIVNDRHYATDTLAAFAVGALSGYALPVLGYYSSGRSPGESARHWSIVPVLSSTTAGFSVLSLLD